MRAPPHDLVRFEPMSRKAVANYGSCLSHTVTISIKLQQVIFTASVHVELINTILMLTNSNSDNLEKTLWGPPPQSLMINPNK